MKNTAIFSAIIWALLNSPNTAYAEKLSPCQFRDLQTKTLRADLLKNFQKQSKNDRHDVLGDKIREITVPPGRNAWLKEIYDLGIVENSESDRLLSSKVLTAELLNILGTNPNYQFFPKTLGLKCFLETYNLLSNNFAIDANREQIRVALKRAFPKGFIVVRDVPNLAKRDRLGDFYRDPDVFITELLKPQSTLYQKEEFSTPYYAEELLGITSGEKIVLQENILEDNSYFVEMRVHTLEHRAVEGTIFPRFDTGKGLTHEEKNFATRFVEGFLQAQPAELTSFHAWAIDVAVLSNGKARILNINTNQGTPNAWSRFQSYPSVIGAYTRHIERYYNVKFTGLSGFLLRNDLANYPRFLTKRLVEGSL